MSNSVMQGQIDAIKLWGDVCGQQANCQDCPIGTIRGTGVTCQEFASKFPSKMLSLLKEMNGEDVSYFKEFCIRFPECNMPVEDLAQCICRKVAFEGYSGCDGGDCTSCWLESYKGDVTEFGE